MLHSVSGKTMNGKEYSLNCKKKKKEKESLSKKDSFSFNSKQYFKRVC